MTETQTVCERNASGDFSRNQIVLNTLHQYYAREQLSGLATDDPELFVFYKAHHEYHKPGPSDLNVVFALHRKGWNIEKPLPAFVSRQYDLLVERGAIREMEDIHEY